MGQDVFQTQADQRFNSFADPMNPINMNSGNGQGQWGMNSNYLTPAYLSPYRPGYQGSNGSNRSTSDPGFFKSANHVFNPLERGGTNYGGNAYNQESPFYSNMANRPMDSFASGMQHYAAPTIASYMAYKVLAKPADAIGRGFATGAARGIMGNSFSPAATASVMRGAGAIGGLAGSAFLPMAVAQGAMAGIDKSVFDPYIAQRSMSNNLQRNFSGVTFGDGSGNMVTGGGMSRRNAAGMSKDISVMGARDLTFNQNEVSQLTDYASRSGLLDNIDGKQIGKRMKEITKQVKLVMTVANTSDFREALEVMSKLQMAGANSTAMSSVAAHMSGLSSTAGVSLQRMMNTTGAQGQYMFQANGLTPFAGQLAAGQAHASFASAFRSGLMSPALMARMGGVEGATQSAVGGAMSMLQSPYTMMYGMNSYFNGGDAGNVTGNVGRFGASMLKGGNTVKNIGDMNLARPAMLSRLQGDRGIQLHADMIHQVAGNMVNGRNSNGNVDDGTAYQILTQTFHLDDEKARGLLQQIRSSQDGSTMGQRLAGADKASKDIYMGFARQNGANMGILTKPVQAVLGVGRSIQAHTAGNIGDFLESVGGATDSFESGWTKAMYGMDPSSGVSAEKVRSGYKGKLSANMDKLTWGNQGDTRLIKSSSSRITDLAQSGNKDAQVVIDSKDPGAKKAALYRLAKQGHIDPSMASTENINKLISNTSSGVNVSEDGGNVDKVVSAFSKIVVGGNARKGSEIMSVMEDLEAVYKDRPEDIGSEAHAKNVKRLGELYGREMSPAEAEELSKKVLANNNQLRNAGRVFKETKGNLTGTAEDFLTKAAGANIDPLAPKMNNVDHVSDDDKRAQILSQMKLDQQKTDIRSAIKNKRIDFGTGQGMINALDNGAASGKFSSAVDKFERIINGGSSEDGKAVPSIWQVAGDKIRKNMG